MKKIGGLRRKTRNLFTKHKKEKGKISLRKYIQAFNKGERAILSLESAVQKGMYHPMFYGRSGIVQGKKGKCYEVLINDHGKQKLLIVHPIHLKKSTE